MTDWRHDELGWFPTSPDDATPLIADELWKEAAMSEQPAQLTYGSPPPLVADAAVNAIGIDVSDNQSSINWAAVAASGRSFAYVKASQGNNPNYPSVDGQYAGARTAGMSVGLYHFADPSQTPESNADAFAVQVNRLEAVQGHLPPCLDLESGTGDLSGWASAFFTRLRAQTECVRVMLYSNVSIFTTQIKESWMDPNIALWIAHPGQPPGQPGYLTPRVAIHQYSFTGAVSGVVGNVDLNYALWDLATLIPSEVELDTTQAAQLTAIYQQLSGSPTVGEWAGWPSWPGGSGRSLTLLDYLRQADVALTTLKAEVVALQTAAPAAGGSLSDADVTRIAAAVADMLGSRIKA